MSYLLEVGRRRSEAKLAGVLLHGRGITPEGKVDLAASVTMRIYDGRSHIVCDEELAEVRAMLQSAL